MLFSRRGHFCEIAYMHTLSDREAASKGVRLTKVVVDNRRSTCCMASTQDFFYSCGITRSIYLPVRCYFSNATMYKVEFISLYNLKPCLYGLGYPRQPSPSRQLYGAFIWSCEL